MEIKISSKQKKITLFLLFAVFFLRFAVAWGEDKKPQTLFVPVYQVVDERFPALDEKEIQKIFTEAKILLKDKFGVVGEFEYKGQMTREKYDENFYYLEKPPVFVESTEDGKKIWETASLSEDEKKVGVPEVITSKNMSGASVDVWELFGKNDIKFESYENAILNNIAAKWNENELSQFLDSRATLSSNFYETVAETLFKKYRAALFNVRRCLVNEKPLLSHSWNEHVFESASSWYGRRRMEVVFGNDTHNPKWLPKDAFIFYNGPVFEDEIGIPHTMVTGIVNGTTAFVSTFPAYINPSCFQDKIGKVEDELKAKVDAVVFVHEMGHTFFNLPDYFAKEKEGCMMYVGPKAIDLMQRYELVKNSPPCWYEMNAARKAMEK